MRVVLPTSIALGLGWNLIVRWLMGARRPADLFEIGWMVAGALAGAVAGAYTVRVRDRVGSVRRFADGLAAYYLAMAVYGAAFVLIDQVGLSVRHGGWTTFDLSDRLRLIASFAVYGTLWYGIGLIPLAFVSRTLILRAYEWGAGRAEPAG